jgi:hypothetical protein
MVLFTARVATRIGLPLFEEFPMKIKTRRSIVLAAFVSAVATVGCADTLYGPTRSPAGAAALRSDDGEDNVNWADTLDCAFGWIVNYGVIECSEPQRSVSHAKR